MPKTSEYRNLIQEGNSWLTIFHHGLGYRIAEDEVELRALALTMRDIFRNKFKEAEKRIDEEFKENYNASGCKITAKQILKDCFGAGK